jgi:hypothetical protein
MTYLRHTREAQRELDIEIDLLAAKLIRERGYDQSEAIHEAQRRIRERRERCGYCVT